MCTKINEMAEILLGAENDRELLDVSIVQDVMEEIRKVAGINTPLSYRDYVDDKTGKRSRAIVIDPEVALSDDVMGIIADLGCYRGINLPPKYFKK